VAILLRTDAADVELVADVTSALTAAGFSCETTPLGVRVTVLDVVEPMLESELSVVAVVSGGTPVAPFFAQGFVDVAQWPQDRDALPFRLRSLLDAQAVRGERDLYRVVLDTTPSVMFVKSRAGRFLFANKALANSYAVADPNDLIGKQSTDLQQRSDARAAIDAATAALYASGEPLVYEVPIETKNGGLRWKQTSIALGPVHDSERVLIGTSQDITMARSAELELRRQHGLLRQVMDASPGLIFVKDDRGRFVVVNAAFARIHERTPEQLIGMTASELLTEPAEAAEWREAEERATRARVPIVNEDSMTTRDKSVLRFLSVRCAFDDDEGKKLTLTIATDITARRKAEDNFEQYRAMVEMSRTLGLVTDLNGVILRASRAWFSSFGYPEYALVGTSILSLLHPEDRARHSAARQWPISADVLDGAEVRCRAHDGTYLRLVWSVAVDEQKKRGFAVAHDITELRRAERSAEEARANAVQASRIKSQFVANMSHEIRTPMNGVLGMLALALDTPLSPEQHGFLQDAYDSAEALLVIINDILDISKVEAGRMVLEKVPFVIRDVVRAAVAPQFARAKQKGLATRILVDDLLPDTVLGDPVRLRQVLVNLVANAVKFTEEGVISVRVRIEAADGEVVHVAVADTGIGVPPEKHERIFEAFRQADESTTRTHGGTGLGLSICRELTKLMDGRIWLESEVGCGTTFHFTARLPFAENAPDTAPSEAVLKAFDANALRLRVLLADDNAVNTKLAVRLLEKNGCEVLAAPNGLVATEIAAREELDLILMDLQMPIMDGFEATRRIRDGERSRRRVPIVALTASAMKDDEQRCLAAGMDGHLAKPLDASKLAELVSRLRSGVASTVAAEAPRSKRSVDIAEVRERCDNDPNLVREVVDAFRESCREGFVELEEAVETGDLVVIRRVAHRLRGALLYVAAGPAAKIASQLEHLDGDANGSVPLLVAQLKKETESVDAILLAESQRRSAAPPAA
jgi:PAS domain S-box-containing protein